MLLALTAAAQTPKRAQPARWLDVTLDRMENEKWWPVEPGTVMKQGEHVRFRFKANFAGYVYVVNHGTSGVRALLFPNADAGMDNTVQPAKEYRVPSTQASFRIDGPAGHDQMFWIISATPLSETEALELTSSPPPEPTLLPRCDETLMRARGECVDTKAGPRMISRELTIVQKNETAHVSVVGKLTKPLMYQFRLAHE
ncbi:MAG: DUF4384 domain-containing protein [Acidobacteriota bacterium]